TPAAPVMAITRARFAAWPSWARNSLRRSPRAAWEMSLASARRSCWRNATSRSSDMGGPGTGAQELDDLRQRRARAEDAGHAQGRESRHVGFGNDAAHDHAHVTEPGFPQFLHQLWNERHVSAAEKAEAEPVGILIGDGAHHSVDGLPQARV